MLNFIKINARRGDLFPLAPYEIMKKETISYLVYARKSMESSERQIQSIDDQIAIAMGYGLKIVDVISEAKSGKLPYKRKGFDELVRRLKKGEAQGIICWKLDRLSRNPEEAGIIMGMLQRSEIQHIKTYEREYHPQDSALIAYVDFGIANQVSRDISVNAKRGVRSKLEKGWRPGACPQGYINSKTKNRGENTVDPDPERFDIIKEAWQRLLSGNWTPIQILRWLTDDCGFRTRKTAKMGGKPFGRSSIYRIFTNEFYAGNYYYKGEYYTNGQHKKMITLEEYDRAQVILGKRGKPRVNPDRQYAYTEIIRCKICGRGVTGTIHRKLVKRDGLVHEYTHYYCRQCCLAHRGTNRYTNVTIIEEAIERELERLTILPEFRDWALDILDETKDETRMSRQKASESRQRAVDAAEREISGLIRMHARGLIDDDEFTAQKNAIKTEQARVLGHMKDANAGSEEWIDLTRQTFEFASYAHKAFLFGDTQTRREILAGLTCMNCTLWGKDFNIHALEWFVPIQEFDHPLLAEFESVEPEIQRTYKTDERFRPLSVAMRG